MDLNKVVGRIERELAGGFPALSIRQVLAEGAVNARGPEVEDDLIAIVFNLVREAEAQSVQLVTGFRSRHGTSACADVLEYSVLTITLNLKPNVMGDHFAAAESQSPDVHALIQSIEAFGGKLEIAVTGLSRLRLTLCLPYTEESSESFAAEEGSGQTVLLVEDEDFVRGVTREVLEMAGYQVLEATNGENAIAVFDEHQGKVDLVLTDVVMPGMNGRDLAERLAQKSPRMKTLFMSGYTENAVLRRGLENDCAAYLQKPFALETLTEKVREVLCGGVARAAQIDQRPGDTGSSVRGA